MSDQKLLLSEKKNQTNPKPYIFSPILNAGGFIKNKIKQK